jgi:putative membrane protein
LRVAAIPRLPRPSTVGALTTIVFLSLVIAAFVPGVILPLTMAQVGFALLHGARRYGWRAIGVFVAAGLVISNVLENLSIKAGFPFGHYHYTGGGKIFQVPWFIGPAYLATGYLAWIVATVLVDDVGRNARWPSVIGTPVIGAFAMAAWDLALDPSSSTIDHHWIWENGGGFFGVPLGNFLGWTFTVYLFMQVFSLYLRRRGPARAAQPDATTRSDLQALLLYAATTVSYIATLFTGKNTIVTDAAGRAWHTADIYESSALLATYGMGFIALLAVLRIIQRRQDEPTPTTTPVPVPVQQPMAYNPTR